MYLVTSSNIIRVAYTVINFEENSLETENCEGKPRYCYECVKILKVAMVRRYIEGRNDADFCLSCGFNKMYVFEEEIRIHLKNIERYIKNMSEEYKPYLALESL